MIHLAPQPDKRTLDAVTQDLIAQGMGRGELASYLRRLAHEVARPIQTQRRVMDLRQKRAKLEGDGLRSYSGIEHKLNGGDPGPWRKHSVLVHFGGHGGVHRTLKVLSCLKFASLLPLTKRP